MKTGNTSSPPAGGPTKDEILAISLFKLGLTPEDTFADLGCGTGRVSIEASKQVKALHGVDRREEAYIRTKKEVETQEKENIFVHRRENKSFLTALTALDTAFVDGSQGLDTVLESLARLNVRSLVINAVMLETVITVVTALKKHGMFKEIILTNIARSNPIGFGVMFKPLVPVYIISEGRASC
ncbi:MAG: cobalt-precorrin-6Y C(15)-methyltransferase [Methanospirillum sp.]|uniref:cobalt-precorrin-6Y C(15)-methyltransferase n=1 Tax=Methanospirillum sp. TaxID=45200 RepID=UPI0023747A94|nr:cobalt-precorrin-6Y C(15)-methyltransferase [Methanospirillum sp.]MDD1729279.1 cobalt-precorrin-6Y C(15)-methyltransferase [Methanospirillum sp.]